MFQGKFKGRALVLRKCSWQASHVHVLDFLLLLHALERKTAALPFMCTPAISYPAQCGKTHTDKHTHTKPHALRIQIATLETG